MAMKFRDWTTSGSKTWETIVLKFSTNELSAMGSKPGFRLTINSKNCCCEIRRIIFWVPTNEFHYFSQDPKWDRLQLKCSSLFPDEPQARILLHVPSLQSTALIIQVRLRSCQSPLLRGLAVEVRWRQLVSDVTTHTNIYSEGNNIIAAKAGLRETTLLSETRR